MALRLLKVLVPRDEVEHVREILGEHGEFPSWVNAVEGEGTEIQVVLPAEGNELILNDLMDRLEALDGFRLVLLPVQATVPRIEEPEEEEEGEAIPAAEGVPPGPPEAGSEAEAEEEESEKTHARVFLEELHTSMSDDAETSPFYLWMVALSTVVACAGLMMGDTAVIIGAMVIAPLLGPNMALAFATTLGDLDLLRSAWWTATVGAIVALAVAVAAGVVLVVDPEGVEIASRTRVGAGNVALALAAGAAGALALTRGVAAGLVGVMVAVALLPPLAVAGLLLGDARWEAGIGAILLTAANIACVNLAGIATFLYQGVQPRLLWEESRARKATIVAVLLWTGLVAGLLVVVWLAWGE